MPMRSTRTRANSSPSGAPTTNASRKPVRKSSADSKNWVMNSPRVISCQSRTSVSENGTMKALLVARPAISQSRRPARTLAQTGAWRRMAVLSTRSDLFTPVIVRESGQSSNPCAADITAQWDYWIPALAGMTALCKSKSRSLHHRIGVFPDAGVDEFLIGHGLLVGFDRANLLHQGGDRIDLVLRQAVVLGRPEVDRQELLERRLVHFFIVAGAGGGVG